jgi:hypothetical protein
MRRRDLLLLGATMPAAIVTRRVRGQTNMTKRAAVVIGVDRPGNLPPLKAAASGANKVGDWLKSEGFDEVKRFTDDVMPVKAGDIFDAVDGLLKLGTLQQLVVYFAGHGSVVHYSELWLLSEAPHSPNAAVSTTESCQLAQRCGIPNVVFISDTCRSTSADLAMQHLSGQFLFPGDINNTRVDTAIDIFLATALGAQAVETLDAAAGKYNGIYTDCFLSAYVNPSADMIENVGDLRVVPNRKLEPYLKSEMARRTENLDIQQLPETHVTSSNYIAQAKEIAHGEPHCPPGMYLYPNASGVWRCSYVGAGGSGGSGGAGINGGYGGGGGRGGAGVNVGAGGSGGSGGAGINGGQGGGGGGGGTGVHVGAGGSGGGGGAGLNGGRGNAGGSGSFDGAGGYVVFRPKPKVVSVPLTITDLSEFELGRLGLQINKNTAAKSWPAAVFKKIADDTGFTANRASILNARGPNIFRYATGISVFGTRLRTPISANMETQILRQGDGSKEPAIIQIDLRGKRQGSMIIEFEDGSGTVIAVLQGYGANVVVEKGQVISVSYALAKKGNLGRTQSSQRADQLRALVATSAKFGSFRIDGPPEIRSENAGQLAEAIRIEEPVDPTLGIYGAYAYADAGLLKQIRSLHKIMKDQLGMHLFDVAMLSGALSEKRDPLGILTTEEPVEAQAPFCPMLSQGWQFLRVRNVRLPEHLANAQNHVLPALWTTFDREGMSIIKASPDFRDLRSPG